ncbi:GNAT family N-acetyltransferase [Listeria grandensis]|uniref:GNAT family N-acetyltransferase n=1 Tax=Listeria grandensis TaxID=1494963 RepID=UPI001626AF61|nr:GNAT family N-acetyltransferase [Listeria grandensis]MBC1474355.1 GNAT family N-acetyltransferase [Listeria grandensis]
MVRDLEKKRNYHVKFLTENDVALAEAVCAKCEDYFLMEQGSGATRENAHTIITEIPEGKTKHDKFVMAVLDEADKPIGLIDVVADFPRKGQWIIGLLMLIPEERESGFGKVLYKVIKDWATDGGADSLRIGVLDENAEAIGFWSHLGFEKEEEKQQTYGNKEHVVHVMTQKI